nr:hypothetical protein [Tanacetum cinerariifolium]
MFKIVWTPAWAFGFVSDYLLCSSIGHHSMLLRTRGRSSDQGNGGIGGRGGQVGGQGSEVNNGVDGVPDFSTIIAQQLQNLFPTIVAQVGSQGSDQGNGRNQNGDAINDNIKGDVRNVIADKNQRGCTYKEFLACNLKEYDGKGAFRNGSIKKNPKKRGNRGEPSKDRNVRDDNKRTRTGNAFAITTNPVGREDTGTVPKCTTCNTYHPPEVPCRTCFKYNCPGYFAKECRVMPRNVNPVNVKNPA